MVNRCFQMPFPQLLNMYRVRRACTLLTENEVSITEISQLCGYDSPRSFNRNFKAVMNLTPREFRQRGEANEDENENTSAEEFFENEGEN